MIKAKDAREIAKNTLATAIGCAYYKISDDDSISDEDKEAILFYINKYGKSACKAFNKEYITY